MKFLIIVLTLILPDGSVMQKALPVPSVELNKIETCNIAVHKTVDELTAKFKDVKVCGACFELDGNDIDKLLPPKA